MIRSTGVRSVAERRWLKVFRTLNEFQARLFAADKALDLGRGGMSRLSALTGLSRTTITKAVEELESGGKLAGPGEGRVRRVGGGRKKVEGIDPGVRDLLAKILEETTAGRSNESVAVDEQIDANDGGGVDSFRAPRVVGNGSALPERYGVFLAGQPQVEGGPQHADRDA